MNKSIWRFASRRLQVYRSPTHSGTHVGESLIDGTFGHTDALAKLLQERAVDRFERHPLAVKQKRQGAVAVRIDGRINDVIERRETKAGWRFEQREVFQVAVAITDQRKYD